jgi:hypothetical protein
MTKEHPNNSKGRPPKGKETLKAVTFRLQPSTKEKIEVAAILEGCSQSDIIEKMVHSLLD